MRKIVGLFAVCLALAGCAGLQQKIDIATGIYTAAVETTVPANVVIPTANAFDILKAGATNYGKYCIAQNFVPSICDANVRRAVIKSVRAGTAARKQMKGSLRNNEPAASSIYNVLVAAVQGLQTSPAASAKFVEPPK